MTKANNMLAKCVCTYVFMCDLLFSLYYSRQARKYILETYITHEVVPTTVPSTTALPFSPSDICMGEPLMINPNSYARVREVLKHIQEHTQSEQRVWHIVGSDGVPYVLGQRLRDESPELRNILLIPGAGHIEMNALKALFKLLWPIGLEQLAKLVGYRSDKALQYCLKAADHHKSWELITIFFKAAVIFMLKPYLTQCQDSKTRPTVQDALASIQKVVNPTHKYMYDVTFTYVLALFLYRQGIRTRDPSLVLCAETTLSELFFGTNMTTYMDLYFRHVNTYLKAPLVVQTCIQQNYSCSDNSDEGRCEGGDFILEARNRRIKMFRPPGVPTHAQWTQMCRLVDKLTEV